jgi:hypothetical protein
LVLLVAGATAIIPVVAPEQARLVELVAPEVMVSFQRLQDLPTLAVVVAAVAAQQVVQVVAAEEVVLE